MKFLKQINCFLLFIVAYSTSLTKAEKLLGLYGILFFAIGLQFALNEFDSYLRAKKMQASILLNGMIFLFSSMILYHSSIILMVK